MNISNTGVITADYRIVTPLLYATTIRASNATVVTIQDDARMTCNLIVNGTITASNSNPFYTAGKVSTAGVILTSKGRGTFTASRSSTGVFVITPTIAFGNTNYLINISCQYGGGTGCYSVFTNSLATTGFTIITMNNSSYSACIFHFTMMND